MASDDFDIHEFIKTPAPKPPGKPVDPLYSTGESFTTRTAKETWPYVRAFGGGAAKEVAGDVQTLGELLPDPLSPLLPDVAKQARKEGGKDLRKWTESTDPEHSSVETAGRIAGGLAEGYALPLPSAARAREEFKQGKGLVEKGLDWALTPSTGPPYYAKGVPFGPKPKAIPARISQKGVQGSVPNPEYEKAAAEGQEAVEKAEAKAAGIAKGVGDISQGAMRGAVGGATQPGKQDKGTEAEIGGAVGASMSALSTAYNALPPKWKAGVDFAAVAPIAAYFWHHGNLSPEQAVTSAIGWWMLHGAMYLRHVPSLPAMGSSVLASPAAQAGAAAAATHVPEVLYPDRTKR